MNIDHLMRDTFTAHEHLVPDEAEVLAAVHRRIGPRHRVLLPALAVAASVTVVAGVAGGAVLLSRSDHAPTPHRAVAAAGSSTAGRAVSPASP